MSYDHWKTTNPDDEWLGPDPDDDKETDDETHAHYRAHTLCVLC